MWVLKMSHKLLPHSHAPVPQFHTQFKARIQSFPDPFSTPQNTFLQAVQECLRSWCNCQKTNQHCFRHRAESMQALKQFGMTSINLLHCLWLKLSKQLVRGSWVCTALSGCLVLFRIWTSEEQECRGGDASWYKSTEQMNLLVLGGQWQSAG